MLPFICTGDGLTIAPLAGLRFGGVVAFLHPGTSKPAVHRIVRACDAARVLQGNTALEPDG
jgi:hypothetical protein